MKPYKVCWIKQIKMEVMPLILFSASPQYGIFYYDTKSDLLYQRPYKDDPSTSGAVPGFFTALFLGTLLLMIGFHYQWNWWKWILSDLLLCGIVFAVARKKRCKFERKVKKGKKLVLQNMRKRELEMLLEAAKRMPLIYFRVISIEEAFPLIIFLEILIISTLPDRPFATQYFWPAAVALVEIYLFLLPKLPEKARKACIQRIKRQIKLYESVHHVTSSDCAESFVKLFPQAQNVYDAHLAANGRLILDLFLVEALTQLQFEAELSGSQPPTQDPDFYHFLEEMWRYGDENVYDVISGVGLEHLAENAFIWHRFCEYISDDFLTEINAEIVPQNPLLAGTLNRN